MHFEGVEHAFARHDNLLGLLLALQVSPVGHECSAYRQRADQGGHFLSRLPLGQLATALLARPDGRVNDLSVSEKYDNRANRTFKKSWPVRGLKMKIAPLIGFVVQLPSKVL